MSWSVIAQLYDENNSSSAFGGVDAGPFTIAAGDLIVCIARWEGGGAGDTATLSIRNPDDVDQGFTPGAAIAVSSGGEDEKIATAYKVYSGSDATYFSLRISAAREYRRLSVIQVRSTVGSITLGSSNQNQSTDVGSVSFNTNNVVGNSGALLVGGAATYNDTGAVNNFTGDSAGATSFNTAASYLKSFYRVIGSPGSQGFTGQFVGPDSYAAVVLEFREGGGTVTGSGAITVSPATLSGAGAVTRKGTGSISIGAITLSGSGNVGRKGTGAITVGATQLAGAGARVIAGTGSITAPAAEVAGTGERHIEGAGALQLAAAELSGSGLREGTGSGDIEIQPVEVAGSGAVSGANTGSGALLLDEVVVAGSGIRQIIGAGSITFDPAQVAGTGTASGEIAGVGAITLDPVQLAGAGTITRIGSGAITFDPVEVAGVGQAGNTTTGSGDITLDVTEVSGDGFAAPVPIDGDAGKKLPAYGSVTLYSNGAGRLFTI